MGYAPESVRLSELLKVRRFKMLVSCIPVEWTLTVTGDLRPMHRREGTGSGHSPGA
jgi:hypothetical protein